MVTDGSTDKIVLADYHVHSTFSPDATDTVDAMCEAAAAAGFGEICFTDHADFEPKDESYGLLNLRFDEYRGALEAAVRKWEGVLSVRIGVEADYQDWYDGQVERFLEGRRLDFVLGSVHWVDRLATTGEVFDRYDLAEAYRRYLENVLGAARSGLYDAIAHLDSIKRYAFDKYGEAGLKDFRQDIEAILRVMVDNGTALEINSSGLRRALGRTMPDLETLRLYRQLGGELLTIGSDAHSVRYAGFGVREAVAVAKAAGFRYITVYHDRRPEFLSID